MMYQPVKTKSYQYVVVKPSLTPSHSNEEIEYEDDPKFKSSAEFYGKPTEILPFLFLGSQFNANDQKTIESLGITYILNVALEVEGFPLWFKGGYKKLIIKDKMSTGNNQYPEFEKAFAIFDECEKTSSKCLIHCARGRSRSAAVVIAYLMNRKSMSLKEAYEYVKELRPLIGPHANLRAQLVDYDTHLFKIPSLDQETIKTFLKSRR
eukprot:TRINITY_DN437_c0_g2_i1.p1 TRINITY_DN437_c0_g2~~TRINITY_DN437_c0_g2_i1.p1  ORF type:complete len:208 (-),score=29.94 TRINITY_DN437_c0_g2_i1:122-745(-)